MDIFTYRYKKNILFSRLNDFIMMLEDVRIQVQFTFYKDSGIVCFQDEAGNHWSYGEKSLTIRNGHSKYVLHCGHKIEIEGTTITFTRTKEEVIKKAENYFFPYIYIKHKLDFRIEDMVFYSN